MQNFELIFQTVVPESDYYGKPGFKYNFEFRRIITEKDIEQATKIGQAMIGEEIYSSEFLSSLISIKQTKKPAKIAYWNRNHEELVWQRVLKRLCKKNEKGKKVEFIKSEGKKVGVNFN